MSSSTKKAQGQHQGSDRQGYDPVVFGKDQTENVVDVFLSGDKEVTLVFLDGSQEVRKYVPYLFASDPTLFARFDKSLWKAVELQGDLYYKYLVYFDGWEVYEKITKDLRREIGYDSEKIYTIRSAEQQYLMHSGVTLYKGTDFFSTRRLAFDIETITTRGFSNAKRKEDHIYMVSFYGTGGFERVLYVNHDGVKPNDYVACKNEKELLEKFVETIQEFDPHILQGYNVLGFDFPYILQRAKRCRVELALGIDGSVPQTFESTKRFAERDLSYTNVTIRGRTVIDVMFEVYNYDTIKRDLPGYKLKEVAIHFGFADETRTYIEGERLTETWYNAPEDVLAYAMDDAKECFRIADHLCGASFYYTRMVPMTYQKVALLGVGSKLESAYVREYIRQRHSIPKPEKGKQEVGGYTDLFKRGVYAEVVYADVDSLYPSIMLAFNVKPQSDVLGVFQYFLRANKDLRFETKGKLKGVKRGTSQYQSIDNEQSSYKININGAYGYLGYARGLFNDFSEADRVTVIGQKILQVMIQEVRNDGGDVIEGDTDGILALCPPYVQYGGGELREGKTMTDEDWVRALTERLPVGIEIDFDGRADKMFSYKKKNYALLEPGKTVPKYKGGSLVSRQYEKFGRDFMQKVVRCILDEDVQGIRNAFVETRTALLEHRVSIRDLSKTQNLKDDIEDYVKKTILGPKNGGRNKSAGYELAIRRGQETGNPPEQGDRVTYYIAYPEGEMGKKAYKVRSFEDAKFVDQYDPSFPDENTNYYLARLRDFTKTFKQFFTEEDFKLLFSEKDADVSSVRILSYDIEKTPLEVLLVISPDVKKKFYLDRAVAGAKFLKKMDDDGTNNRIGKILVPRVAEGWAKEQGFECEVYEDPRDRVDSCDAVIVVSLENDRDYGRLVSYAKNLKKHTHHSFVV